MLQNDALCPNQRKVVVGGGRGERKETGIKTHGDKKEQSKYEAMQKKKAERAAREKGKKEKRIMIWKIPKVFKQGEFSKQDE